MVEKNIKRFDLKTFLYSQAPNLLVTSRMLQLLRYKPAKRRNPESSGSNFQTNFFCFQFLRNSLLKIKMMLQFEIHYKYQRY